MFGQLLTTVVYLLKLLYVNSCVVAGRSYGPKPFSFVRCMCLYIFLQLLVRGGALSCALDLAWDQCTIEMSIISSSIHGRTYS